MEGAERKNQLELRVRGVFPSRVPSDELKCPLPNTVRGHKVKDPQTHELERCLNSEQKLCMLEAPT